MDDADIADDVRTDDSAHFDAAADIVHVSCDVPLVALFAILPSPIPFVVSIYSSTHTYTSSVIRVEL